MKRIKTGTNERTVKGRTYRFTRYDEVMDTGAVRHVVHIELMPESSNQFNLFAT
jgi:hypothetical protein